jgi:membrane protein
VSRLKSALDFFKQVVNEWNLDKAPRLAAALSYYTIFSIAPLLIVVIAIAGVVFGHDAVTGQLDRQIAGLVGPESAAFIQEIIRNAQKPNESFIATIIGVVTLLLSAAGFFGQLQDALNTIWNVEPKPSQGILNMLKERFLSFAMVLGVGFLLLVSLVISTILAATGDYLNQLFPGAAAVLPLANTIISFLVITALFAMIYKVLPQVHLEWKDVLIGAAFTALLFTIGKALIGLYLGRSGVASAYGAAGSLVVILLWIYYSAQILLFGAEFTQVYTRQFGSHVGTTAAQTVKEAKAQAAKKTSPAATQPVPSAPLPFVSTPRQKPAPARFRFGTLVSAGAAFITLVVGLLLGQRTAR